MQGVSGTFQTTPNWGATSYWEHTGENVTGGGSFKIIFLYDVPGMYEICVMLLMPVVQN